MKFWKLGLATLSVVLCLGGVTVSANDIDDPILDKNGNYLFSGQQKSHEQAAAVSIEKGLEFAQGHLQKYKNGLFDLEIDKNSVLNHAKEKGYTGTQLDGAFVGDLKEITPFVDSLQEDYSFKFTPKAYGMGPPPPPITLFPTNIKFTIRYGDATTPTPAVTPGQGTGAFIITIFPGMTTADLKNSFDPTKGMLDGAGRAWVETWADYIKNLHLFQNTVSIPDENSEVFQFWKKSGKADFWSQIDSQYESAPFDIALELANNSSDQDIASAIEKPFLLEQMSSLTAQATEAFLPTLKWDSDAGRERANINAESVTEDFWQEMETIDPSSPSEEAITQLTKMKDLWVTRQQILQDFFPFPPVGNGDILAGPPVGKSGYDYIIKRFIPKYINGAISFLLGFGVLFLIIGGITYLVSSGDQELTKKAKDTILWSIVACILAGMAWVFVHFIISINFYPM